MVRVLLVNPLIYLHTQRYRYDLVYAVLLYSPGLSKFIGIHFMVFKAIAKYTHKHTHARIIDKWLLLNLFFSSVSLRTSHTHTHICIYILYI